MVSPFPCCPVIRECSWKKTQIKKTQSYLGYDVNIFDQPILSKIDSVQYNAALAIAGAIKDSSSDRLYQELGLEYPHQRRWMRRLCLPYKFFLTKQPWHTHSLLPQMRNSHRQLNTFHAFPYRTEYFKNSFFHISY